MIVYGNKMSNNLHIYGAYSLVECLLSYLLTAKDNEKRFISPMNDKTTL